MDREIVCQEDLQTLTDGYRGGQAQAGGDGRRQGGQVCHSHQVSAQHFQGVFTSLGSPTFYTYVNPRLITAQLWMICTPRISSLVPAVLRLTSLIQLEMTRWVDSGFGCVQKYLLSSGCNTVVSNIYRCVNLWHLRMAFQYFIYLIFSNQIIFRI